MLVNACAKNKKREVKENKIGLVMVTLVITQVHVGLRITSIIGCGNLVFLINSRNGYNPKPNRSKRVKAITLCC